MNVISVKKGDIVAKRQEKVMEWYLIQLGSVTRQYQFAEIVLGTNSIIGILETEWFTCDYIAREDTTLIVIPCKNSDDLHMLLKNTPNFRAIFLRTALEQRHQALCLYAALKKKAALLHSTAETSYSNYKNLCNKLLISEQAFLRMNAFSPLKLEHRAENWEINNSNSLMKGYLKDYLNLMIRDDGLCVGAIMEAAAQMHRIALGIEDIADYLMFNRDILWNDSEVDIFHLFYQMAARLSRDKQDISECKNAMVQIYKTMTQLGIYEQMQLDECKSKCTCQQFAGIEAGQFNIADEDCVSQIMTYAEYEKEEIRKFKLILQKYKELPDKYASDNDARMLRKHLCKYFYEIYAKAFFRSLSGYDRPSPILMMFFCFGFMDGELLGETNSNNLIRFAESLNLFSYTHIYTIYDWLRNIYIGAKEPSRNEFDMDYNGYLQDQMRQGELDECEVAVLKNDAAAKVRFEIENLFQSTHKTTSGRITTFCPILCEDDLLGTYEKLAATASRIEDSINRIRSVDYSILYREVMFSDPERGINQEWIQQEVMPDIILLPGIGSRAVMWQETSGVKTDTPARFILPIFMSSDLDEQMTLTMGRYRWEICRKIQGNYWNDFREKSLTSEFYDYVQFYKKNKDLSPDAKEKIKSELSHARNNYREVFVADYVNWLKYESAGSFRLNKISRDILTRYCPFSKPIRDSLASNPVYQNAFARMDINNEKKLNRLRALYSKYEAAGGTITPELKENMRFLEM